VGSAVERLGGLAQVSLATVPGQRFFRLAHP